MLVVDDDEGICTTMADILDAMNFDVNVANDGYKAIELVEVHEFAMTLMDVRMPGLDGLETLKRLRKKKPSLKVVIMTAYSSPDTLDEIKKIGVDGILAKPINFTELFRLMPC